MSSWRPEVKNEYRSISAEEAANSEEVRKEEELHRLEEENAQMAQMGLPKNLMTFGHGSQSTRLMGPNLALGRKKETIVSEKAQGKWNGASLFSMETHNRVKFVSYLQVLK